jgi:hypothetical protein
MIKPLRDNIVAVPIEEPKKIGLLWMPENKKQALRVHYRSVVLYSGPKAKELCPPGTIIHVSESWGEEFQHRGKTVWIGRIRDINGICEDQTPLKDFNSYLD